MDLSTIIAAPLEGIIVSDLNQIFEESVNYLLFQPETTARSPTSSPAITDTSACAPNTPRTVLWPPATELPEVELMLSAVAATGDASPGNVEQPTTASTSSTPLPASASSACKLASEETNTKNTIV
jgi:hypothetical protein